MVISLVKDKYLNNLFIRTIISIILLIVISFSLKFNSAYDIFYRLVNDTKIDYYYINSKTKSIIGNILGKREQFVSSNKLIYKSIEKYGNGFKLTTEQNYVVNSITPGVVIFIGNKENLGPTVIVESSSGVCYWYSNIEYISVNLYDYIDEKRIIGSTIDENLILTISKDNKYLNYEDYI